MGTSIPTFVGLLIKAGLAALVANEVRGFVLAAPVLYGMYQAGGTLMAIWLGICSLCGIALSVIGPLFFARKLKLIPAKSGMSWRARQEQWRARQESNLRPHA